MSREESFSGFLWEERGEPIFIGVLVTVTTADGCPGVVEVADEANSGSAVSLTLFAVSNGAAEELIDGATVSFDVVVVVVVMAVASFFPSMKSDPDVKLESDCTFGDSIAFVSPLPPSF